MLPLEVGVRFLVANSGMLLLRLFLRLLLLLLHLPAAYHLHSPSALRSTAQPNQMTSHHMLYCAPRGRSEEEKGAEAAEEVKIVAVDLQAMAPLPGVTQIQGDITKVVTCLPSLNTCIMRPVM